MQNKYSLEKRRKKIRNANPKKRKEREIKLIELYILYTYMMFERTITKEKD